MPEPAVVDPNNHPSNPTDPAGNPPADPPPADPPSNDPPSSDPPTALFPENWRNLLAGDDEKKLAQLGRFTDPQKFAESFFNAQEKIRSGAVREPLPENPTEDQVREWREANGIPLEASGYELQLPEGTVINEEDQPMVDAVVAAMHEQNATPAAVNAAVNAYYGYLDHMMQEADKQDGQDQAATTQQLQEEWGKDYQTNKAVLKDFLSRIPEGVREMFTGARMPDGRALLNNPDVVKAFVEIERMANPTASILPNTTDPAGSVQSRLAEIEQMMRSEPAKYYGDAKVQQEYRDLLDAQDRLNR